MTENIVSVALKTPEMMDSIALRAGVHLELCAEYTTELL